MYDVYIALYYAIVKLCFYIRLQSVTLVLVYFDCLYCNKESPSCPHRDAAAFRFLRESI